ncbi:unnamed protein product [Cuscuta campestris]|uniref:Uncharacterized protein n=1 Tax=Cuscuta campestris TaxID=132261 RepID=A0A484LZG1_9ASTE|nr:unnamed protein product [Cuscuta campestris]
MRTHYWVFCSIENLELYHWTPLSLLLLVLLWVLLIWISYKGLGVLLCHWFTAHGLLAVFSNLEAAVWGGF